MEGHAGRTCPEEIPHAFGEGKGTQYTAKPQKAVELALLLYPLSGTGVREGGTGCHFPSHPTKGGTVWISDSQDN